MASSKSDNTAPAPRYFDPAPLPKQWDVPLPGGGGAVLHEKELWRKAYFYLNVFLVVFVFIFESLVTFQLQLFSTPLYLIDKEKFYAVIHYSQKLFGVAMVSIHQLFAPTTFIIYQDATIPGPLFCKPCVPPSQKVSLDDMKESLVLPKRIILISNHQLYSDWIYIWALAYMARRHGDLKVILKKSLKNIPIWGWGMQFFDFIFLERSWTKDAQNFLAHMAKLKSSTSPLWLLIFPEGTTISAETREKSHTFAEKNGIPVPKHTLLPRSLGLYTCVNSLGNTIDYIYDLTVGIPGVPRGATPQYTYTLASLYVMGLNPGQIHVHFRRFKVSDLPREEEAFSAWLQARWQEKDELLEHFYQKGCFPADTESLPKLCNVSLRHLAEFLQFPVLQYVFTSVFTLIWRLL